jgi:predicted flavoprotein YhiN
VELSIDLLPERSVDEWSAWLESQKPAPDELTIDILRGLIHSRVAQCVIRAAGLDSRTLASDCRWIRIAQCLRDWRMTVTGTENLARSQVTTGGADMSAFNPDTLECLGSPGLYAIGEIHDVDAACGGFNLMWAWVSGIVAGEAAAGTA